jgi:DNA-binding response OmpR family regulator
MPTRNPKALFRATPFRGDAGSEGRGMTNRKILIVDDDSELREALVEQLALHEEFESIAVDNGTKGVQAAKSGQIDLVIMDVGLPDVDGREAVRILRKNGFKAPIIMLTGHNTDSDTILGLESGANDYVTKPFRFAVLLARIRAQLRQHEASEDAVGRLQVGAIARPTATGCWNCSADTILVVFVLGSRRTTGHQNPIAQPETICQIEFRLIDKMTCKMQIYLLASDLILRWPFAQACDRSSEN